MTSTTTTLTTADHYRAADGPLTALLATLTTADWDAPSPCEGWTARDVVDHLVTTQRGFLAERGVDLGPEPVDDDPAARWATHRDQVLAVLADDAVPAIAYDGHFGPTTVGETVVRFYVFDMVAHRWDIARAAGRDEAFSDAELDRMEAGIASFGPALHMDGICKPGVTAPDGADRQARLLATLGRTA